ncbi:hypothetical protein G159_13250 [Planococcus glaciei CHR43]|nr:hypothetical protein G159_13250 [Planococcus glaciei CHR43]
MAFFAISGKTEATQGASRRNWTLRKAEAPVQL